VPVKLDYRGLERREPSSGWWAGLWSEFRSELAEIPVWLLVAVGGLVMAIFIGFIYGWYVLANV
jgi:hypothetical protein